MANKIIHWGETVSAISRISLLGLFCLFLSGPGYTASSDQAELNLDDEGFLLYGYDPLREPLINVCEAVSARQKSEVS